MKPYPLAAPTARRLVPLTVLLSVFLSVLLSVLALATTASAQEYPWCARYSFGSRGAENCGFVTMQQCMMTVSGAGGACFQNPRYVMAPAPKPKRKAL